jgi:antitoxin (DNA-binding transcriptional repressor) of toxin-antitoxin stability system
LGGPAPFGCSAGNLPPDQGAQKDLSLGVASADNMSDNCQTQREERFVSEVRGHIEILKARDLSRCTKEVLERIENGDQFIIVRRGAPVAAIGPPSRATLEAYVFANDPEMRESIRRAEEEIALGKATPLVDDEAADSPAPTISEPPKVTLGPVVQNPSVVAPPPFQGEESRGYFSSR